MPATSSARRRRRRSHHLTLLAWAFCWFEVPVQLFVFVQADLVVDLVPGTGSSRPSSLTPLAAARAVLFFADNGLWRSNGTADGGTIRLLDSLIGYEPLDAKSNMVEYQDRLYFGANNGVTGVELWSTDGTTAGTTLVKDIQTGDASSSSNPTYLTVFRNQLFFTANDGVVGQELWVSDGTEAGTILWVDLEVGSTSSNPSHFRALSNALIFQATTADNGRELWFTDGSISTQTASLLREITPGSDSTNFGTLGPVLLDQVLFFVLGQGGQENTWITDGTTDGTVLLQEDVGSSFIDSGTNMAVLDNTILFLAYYGSESTRALFTTDGTPAGTVILQDLPDTDSYHGFGAVANNQLVFLTRDVEQGTGFPSIILRITDGTAQGTTDVAPVVLPPQIASFVQSSQIVGDVWAFGLFYPEDSRATLWSADGDLRGTTFLDFFTLPEPDDDLGILTSVPKQPGLYLFRGYDDETGYELWDATFDAPPTPPPTSTPTITPIPTAAPTVSPTSAPTVSPTSAPTLSPNSAATLSPTVVPTQSPIVVPTVMPVAGSPPTPNLPSTTTRPTSASSFLSFTEAPGSGATTASGTRLFAIVCSTWVALVAAWLVSTN